MYTYEDTLKSCKEYFQNDLSAKATIDKYLLRNNDGKLLEQSPHDMHHRIADELARIEKRKFKNPLSHDTIFQLLKRFGKIIPQGSPMYGIGNKQQFVSLSNCFVLHEPDDSYGGIMFTDEQLVQICKRRGGVGISLNKLRPEHSPTKNSSRTSTGIVSWMRRYSNSIREVGQSGRRGALMLTLSVHHPQIADFISAKSKSSEITGANISVQYSDEFLKAVENDTEYEQRWPIDAKKPQITKMVRAKEIWDLAVHNAWDRAEPGLQFFDNVLRESPADCYADDGFKTITSNPCSEIFLSILDSCRLLVIVLFAYVRHPFTSKAYFDWEAFERDAKVAQRLMDDIVDLEEESIRRIIKKIEDDPEDSEVKHHELSTWKKILCACIDGRRTGLGPTALGDTIAALGYKYGSPKSIEVTEKIYKTLKLASYRSSVDMAKELGPFPVWDWKKEKNNPFILRIKDEDPQLYKDMAKYGRRNIANLTTAPTGTTSMVASLSVDDIYRHGTTSGIEPLFMESFIRRKKGNPGDNAFRSDFVDESGDHWMHFEVYHPGIELWQIINPDKDISENPYRGYCAEDINWTARVKLQAAAQRHVDHSISSTINLPSDVKEEEVAKIYMEAWRSGCKGMTVYRQGCRDGVLISSAEQNQKPPEKRPKDIVCDVHHISVKSQPYFVLVGLYNNKPYEVFAGKNGVINKNVKHGTITRKGKLYKAIFEDESELSPITAFTSDEEDIVNRLMSAHLRYGTNILHVVQQLEKSKGDMSSFSKSIVRALKRYIKDGHYGEKCPDCSSKLVRQEGCKCCKSCGYSVCG